MIDQLLYEPEFAEDDARRALKLFETLHVAGLLARSTVNSNVARYRSDRGEGEWENCVMFDRTGALRRSRHGNRDAGCSRTMRSLMLARSPRSALWPLTSDLVNEHFCDRSLPPERVSR